MKRTRWMAAFVLGGALAAAATPAFARISISRAERVCEQAALSQVSPPPERAIAREPRANRESVTYTLVLMSDGTANRYATCVVDRESGNATITVTE